MKAIAQLLLALGILFFVEILIFSTAFGKITYFGRQIAEASILSSGDKLDSYVKSYTSSLQLSLLQSIYENGVGSQNDVWKDYSNVYVDDKINLLKQSIKTKTTDYAKQFLDQYKSYSQDTDHKSDSVTIPDSSTLTLTANLIFIPSDWSKQLTGYAVLDFKELIFSFSGHGVTSNENFVPEARVGTYFEDILNGARDMLESNKIFNAIVSALLPSKTGSKDWCVNLDTEPTPEDVFYASDVVFG